ncbi:PAS domain-containing protein [Halarchaeum salinum]|uniref:PAS domain S-box-containing protein n=1 Tax=Halarchaeum salinum TaxID=489912 RepID=A0AAV3S5E1_9EURY
MDEVGERVFDDTKGAERVVLFMSPGRDRELLAEWFGTATDYTVVTATDTDDLPADYDLCLLDDDTSNAWHDAVSERTTDAKPIYLPHVLLTTHDRQDTWHADSVDDVVSLPVGRDELHRRIENHLRTRRASLTLAEREQRLRLFQRGIEAASQGITIADAEADDMPIIYANDAFQRITGYETDEVVGRNCRFLQGRNTDEAAVTTLRKGIERGEHVSIEILNYRKDGTPFWNQLDVVPIRDDDGDITHYLGFQQDVTQRKRRELRLSVLNRVLRHNFRNKMTVIRGYAERIETGESAPEDAEKIRRAADELLQIGTQMYEFDTLVADGEAEDEVFDVIPLVRSEVDALRKHVPNSDIATDLPEHAVITSHPSLRAALRGFFSLFEDDATVKLDIAIHEQNDRVRLTVTDRSDVLSRHDIEIVARDTETPLEHLDRLEPWLLRWAVEQSSGEFGVETAHQYPTVTMHLNAAKSE